MRTTIRIADDLLRAAKKVAADSDRSLGSVIENALRAALTRREEARAAPALRLRTFKGTGVRPGINLDKTSELLELGDKSYGSS